jgi:hypothetical protein
MRYRSDAHEGQQVTAGADDHVTQLSDEICADGETEHNGRIGVRRAACGCFAAVEYVPGGTHCTGDQAAHVAPAFQCSDEMQVNSKPIKNFLKVARAGSSFY